MKIKVLIALMMLPFLGMAQSWTPDNTGVKTTIEVRGGTKFDTSMLAPVRDTVKPSWWNTGRSYNGQIQFTPSGTPTYYFNGWHVFGSGGGGGSGTVTSITLQSGFVSTQNPITTSALVRIDTGRAPAQIVTGGSLNKVKDSILSIAVKYGDTGRTNGQIATAFVQNKIKDSLGAIIDTKGVGTVTSIATTNGTGITGGTITGTGTLALDTTAIVGTKAFIASTYAPISTTVTTNTTQTITGVKTMTTPSMSNPLITGLSSGSTNDSLLVADPTTGAVKRISSSRISSGSSSGVTYLWSAKITDHFEAAKITGVADFAALNTWTNTGQGTLSNLTFDVTAPNYYANYRGMPAVKFTRASSTSMTFTNQAFKQVVVVCNNTDGAVFADFEGIMGNSLSGADWLWYATSATTDMNYGSSGTEIRTQGFTTSTNSFKSLGQTKITTFLAPSGVSSRTTRVGAFWNLAGRFWNGYIQEMIFFSDLLTKEEYTALQVYLTQKYAISQPLQLFIDGNSIPAGGYTGVTTAQGVGNRMILKSDSVNATLTYTYNAAVGGTVTDQNDFNASSIGGIDYRQDYQTVFGRQGICIYSATNQLHGAGDGLLYIADINDYINNRAAVNPDIEVYVPTVLSCDTTYQLETERQIVNNYLRSLKPTKNFKVINVTDPRFDAAAAFTNTTYYVDGIHPTVLGADEIADLWIKAIYKYNDY